MIALRSRRTGRYPVFVALQSLRASHASLRDSHAHLKCTCTLKGPSIPLICPPLPSAAQGRPFVEILTSYLQMFARSGFTHAHCGYLSLCAVPHFCSRASSLSKQALPIHIRRARFQFAGLREARCHALADHSWSLPISVHTGPDPAALCTALSSLPLSGSFDRPLFTLPQLVSGPFALPLPSRVVESAAWGAYKNQLASKLRVRTRKARGALGDPRATLISSPAHPLPPSPCLLVAQGTGTVMLPACDGDMVGGVLYRC